VIAAAWRVLAGACVLATACTADFLVGDGGSSTGAVGSETSAGTPSGSGGEGSQSGPTTGGSASATDTDASATTLAGSSSGETTGGVGSTSQGSDGSSSSGGVPVDGLDACLATDNPDTCEADPACDFDDGLGCFPDICHGDLAAWCGAFDGDACLAVPVCQWLPGEVACVTWTCMEVGYEDCLSTPACAWLGDMATGHCEAQDCPTCYGLEMPGCAENVACSWVEGVCVPD
jgi:hypothetical protein